MKDPRGFCYWLQGFFEISEAAELNQQQVEIIKKKLDDVFVHADLESESVPTKPNFKQPVAMC